jgi:hypothetical protein
MRSKRSLEGELTIDERGSGGKLFESPTVTCSHCQRVVILNPDRSRPRGHCWKCDHYICDTCDERNCMPVRKMFAQIREDAFRREAGYSRKDLLQDDAFVKAIDRQIGIAAFRQSIG